MTPKFLLTLALAAATAGALLASGCACTNPGQLACFSDWPTGAGPAEVGARVAENVLSRKFDFETNPHRQSLIYPEACAWYGALTLAQAGGDIRPSKRAEQRFERFLTDDGARHISMRAHVDDRVIGIVPLQIYLEDDDSRCLQAGLALADAQWADATADGITAEARYWIDDMYMIPALQVQAFRATDDSKYLDRASLAMVAYLDRLQQPNGLFYHGPNSHFYWGRGNGWVAAGMTELLRSLPPDHPQHARILAGYRTMMEALLEHQDTQGMWHQLIDKPNSWPETSCSAMFTFAFVTGVKAGWLEADTYGPAARKAWLALVGYLDENANLREVCVGTGKGQSTQYYLDRPRVAGDLHGQAPMLWTATALLR